MEEILGTIWIAAPSTPSQSRQLVSPKPQDMAMVAQQATGCYLPPVIPLLSRIFPSDDEPHPFGQAVLPHWRNIHNTNQCDPNISATCQCRRCVIAGSRTHGTTPTSLCRDFLGNAPVVWGWMDVEFHPRQNRGDWLDCNSTQEGYSVIIN